MSNENKGRSGNHTYTLKKKGNSDQYRIDNIEIKQDELNEDVEITWLADDTDFEIWFPNNRNPFQNRSPQQGNSVSSKNRRVNRRLRKNAEKGTYYYSIYCTKTNTMAEGNSSPRMIIL